MEIELENLDSIALDTEGYPHSILEIKYKGETFVKKVKFPTHKTGYAMLRQVNTEWTKVLMEKYKNE